MAYQFNPVLVIEALDSQFHFGPADKAIPKIIELSMKYQKQEDFDPNSAPADLTEAMEELFIEGVVDWDIEADGQKVPCSVENRKMFPSTDKIVVAMAYWQKRNELEEKKEK